MDASVYVYMHVMCVYMESNVSFPFLNLRGCILCEGVKLTFQSSLFRAYILKLVEFARFVYSL